MNAQRCLEMLREIKDCAFATVDETGAPQVRIIDVMLDYVKSETAAGREIGYSTDGRVRILD